ncbi:unnamed protein product [Calicophoron daubneyi]|uniref:protein-tyrosine-phosphatase n=1 Tax=Calicophoron daubneyi TaxID=300641 RepID=A0AAV2TFR7_CALDB
MESSIILDGKSVRLTEPRCVAEAIRMGQNIILLDSRSFVEYNTSHINRAVNIGGNRAVKKKFFKYEVPVDLLLAKLVNVVDTNELKLTPIIVYDQCVEDLGNLRPDCFLHCVLLQLLRKYSPIFVLRGGFLGFRAVYPDLCWESSEKLAGEDIAEYQASDCGLEQILDQCLSAVGIEVSPSPSPSSSATSAAASSQSSSGSTSLSLKTFSLTESGAGNPGRQQPSIGDIKSSASTPFSPESPRPSPILPHVVLGSQADAVSAATCQQYGITHVINVSVDGAAPSHIPADRFFRIPVHDNYTDIMIPFFKDAFTFIDNAKAVRGKVLIHCSAGISRSPTLAIAYLMYSGRMTMREAYKEQNPKDYCFLIGLLSGLDKSRCCQPPQKCVKW